MIAEIENKWKLTCFLYHIWYHASHTCISHIPSDTSWYKYTGAWNMVWYGLRHLITYLSNISNNIVQYIQLTEICAFNASSNITRNRIQISWFVWIISFFIKHRSKPTIPLPNCVSMDYPKQLNQSHVLNNWIWGLNMIQSDRSFSDCLGPVLAAFWLVFKSCIYNMLYDRHHNNHTWSQTLSINNWACNCINNCFTSFNHMATVKKAWIWSKIYHWKW